jgi:glycosyltransferase involved in cell wall biosynthesis
MYIIIITKGSYPYGGAVTNRHLSYLKGMADLDLQIAIKLIVLQPDKKQSALSNKQEGNFNGINFEYANWYNKPPRSLGSKFWHRLKSHIKAVQIINRELLGKSRSEIKLIVSVASLFDILPYLYLSKKNKIQVFHERAEYPFVGVNGFFQKLLLKIYLQFIIPKFDGIFVISKALNKYFAKYVKDSSKILHLPMTVEFERFNIQKSENTKYGKYIAYCGSMYTDKDGVPDLIDAFTIFCSKNTDTNLVLIGDNKDQLKFKKINDCIQVSPFKTRIFCTGWVDRDQMPEYLVNASVLALDRPNNLQAQGGFPTKLGEYLATANPVVITDVGEHKYYLTDEVSAYISEPGDAQKFADKLLKAIDNPAEAGKIGFEGRKIALEHFNYQLQARKLFDFINSIHHA